MASTPFSIKQFDIKQLDIKAVQTEAARSAHRVLDAGVGVSELAVEAVRDYLASTQRRVSDVRRTVGDFEPRAFGAQAVRTVNGQVLAMPSLVQQVVDTNVGVAADTYGELIERGRTLMGRIRGQQSTEDTVATVETTVAPTTTTAAKKTAPAKKATAAKKTAPATKATGTPKAPAAKKTTAAGD